MAPPTDQRPGFLRRHRTAILIVSLLLFLPPLALVFQLSSGDGDFCGTWCPRMFFAWREGVSFGDFMLGMLRSYLGVLLVLAILLSTFFFGRWWCSHLCPVGGATELGSRLFPRRLKIPYHNVPAAPVRYGYLAVYLIAPALGLGSLCCSYCNFAAVPRFFGAMFTPADLAYFLRTAGLINLALLFLLGFLARGGRAYCNFFCPIGALDALVSRFGARWGKRQYVLAHQCTGCGDCQKVCPTWSISLNDEPEGKAAIDTLSCMPCGACQTTCPEGAIRYGKAP